MLGIDGLFLAKLSETVINESKDGYPELEEKSAMIFKVLSEEEDKFNRTIDQGLAILADMEEDMNKKGEKVLLKVKKEKINVFTKDGGTNLIRSDAYEKQ